MAKIYQHLDYAERVLIQTQLGLGMKPCLIADGRSQYRDGSKSADPMASFGRLQVNLDEKVKT
jgi:hypothetical protein